MKKAFGRAAVAVVLTGVGMVGMSTGAIAGEITGNYDAEAGTGKYIEVNGKSHCAFSGQNDGFHDATQAEGSEDARTRTQTPGGAVRSGMPGRLVGMFCNPTFEPPAE